MWAVTVVLITGAVSLHAAVGLRGLPSGTGAFGVWAGLSVGGLICWIVVPDRVAVRRLFYVTVGAALLIAQPVAVATGMALVWADFVRSPPLKAVPLVLGVFAIASTTWLGSAPLQVLFGVTIGLGCFVVSRRLIGPAPPGEGGRPLRVELEVNVQAIAKLRAKVEAHQWTDNEIDWPEGPLPTLEPNLVRLINQVIYIEEIAGKNFRLLEAASGQEDLRVVYGLFADEERRHADGLRKVLDLHGHALQPPGLGASMILDQFDTLDPSDEADAALIAIATPVFEVFLDGGTIPFIQQQPALRCEALDALVERVNRDEAAHMAMDWFVSRDLAVRHRGVSGLALLFNSSIPRGMLALPWLSLDIHSLAYVLGYDFRVLLTPFSKVWRMHHRFPELNSYALWQPYRLFVICGVAATYVCIGLDKAGLMMGGFWVGLTAVTNRIARALFGPDLLARRQLPPASLST